MRNASLATLLFIVASYSAVADAAGGNITGVIGFRQFDTDQWSPTDTQGLLGAQVDFSYWDFPLHVELGLRGSSDSGTLDASEGFSDVKQEVGDFTAGIMLIPDYGYVRPYFDVGVATVQLHVKKETDVGDFSDDDTSAGVYVGGGILWRLTPNFDLGIDARYLGGTSMRIRLDGPPRDVDADNYAFALKIGYGWDLHRRGYEPERRRRRPW